MHPSNPGPTIPGNIAQIGDHDSLWYSSSPKSHYAEGEGGMCEYHIPTRKVINVIEYPEDENIAPFRQFCCKYSQHEIYIIDGEMGNIILFDAVTKTFEEKVEIPNIGGYPCGAVLGDKINIVHG